MGKARASGGRLRSQRLSGGGYRYALDQMSELAHFLKSPRGCECPAALAGRHLRRRPWRARELWRNRREKNQAERVGDVE